MNPGKAYPQESYKILIVDDELAVHKLLTAYLQKRNFVVENCLDSQEVVEMVQAFQPDLVLLDLMMPTVDGISATRRIRNLELDSYLPIIVLTAKKEIRDMVVALEAGADDYITKPFEFEELIARIKNMLRLKQLQDRLVMKTVELNEANQQIRRLNRVLVQTNKQLQKKLYDFHNLFEVSYRVMGQLELSQLVRQSLINILGIFTTRSVMLLLADDREPDVFRVVDSRGVRPPTVEQFVVSRHDKLIHYLEVIKKAFRISDVPEEFKEILPVLQEVEVEVVSPLFQNENIVGILCLGPNFKGEAYTEDNLETLGILTNMLSVAVHNAQMYEHIRELSYTDGMTGLHNFRFFEMRLKEELARARRENSPLSLLILDVDYFKNYNDALGHPAGDEVLRKVSKILKSSVRDNDIVARYGGEEFAIILPGAGKLGAVSLAERIRTKVEITEFANQEIQPEGKLTVSIGVATFPEDALTEAELIDSADKALYHAKKTGRNRVVEARELQKEP
ncbi:MAG: diguanylate cyclase [Calditrichaeota bacterium]|nr:MAG: diguanylate cyclase [Calditrichota bacterium]